MSLFLKREVRLYFFLKSPAALDFISLLCNYYMVTCLLKGVLNNIQQLLFRVTCNIVGGSYFSANSLSRVHILTRDPNKYGGRWQFLFKVTFDLF